ncbi:MAG: OmpA family protein [Bacteroidetes bacterium]|nr:OmpA family protein [Bacteroidota bacterium]
MRIFSILMSLLFIGSAGQISAQSSAVHDSAHISIKSDRMPYVSHFNTWDVAAHLGVSYPNTDIAASTLTSDKLQTHLMYGIDLTKFLSHSFAFQGRFLTGKMSGTDNNKPYHFETDVKYDLSINALFQFGNIAFLKRTPNLAIYASIGVGVIRYVPHVYYNYPASTHVLNGVYIQGYDVPVDSSKDYGKTSELIIPFNLGIKYRISKHFSLNAEYSLRTMNSDKLDGWYRLLSEDDDYSYGSIGLTYHIGSRDKMAEWVNPLQSVYADLYDMKDKVDQLGTDTDKDGVADLFDKEPDTPEGTKVYGDGTSVDSDGDGVPDFKDVEPFSAKLAKVDAAGKEIDTDGDGIPDVRDMEPATSKGSLVNNQGITIQTAQTEAEKQKSGSSSIMASSGYLPSIFFDLNSDLIATKYDETLASIALVMMKNPDLKFMISGNCDARASSDYNAKLGKRRAEAVKRHLVKRYKIDPSRLSTESLGKAQPITGAHPMNRRVDFSVVE